MPDVARLQNHDSPGKWSGTLTRNDHKTCRNIWSRNSGALPLLHACYAALIGIVMYNMLMVSAQTAELVMFDRAGCAWCLRWEQDVGPIYPKTPEGKRAPLRHVSLDRAIPQDLKLKPAIFYTPTFVLMEKGREIGRITGYMGDDAFWGLLGVLMHNLDEHQQKSDHSDRSSPTPPIPISGQPTKQPQ